MDKAPEAFRTISEVAEVLETPAHVLRFWESRFPQIKPVKRAGGRRYYRPADVALLAGIRHLLHTEGMTIRGVQKVLREQGIRHVAALGGADISALDMEAGDDLVDNFGGELAEAVSIRAEPGAQIVPIDSLTRKASETLTATPPAPFGAAPIPSAEIQPLFSGSSEAVGPSDPALRKPPAALNPDRPIDTSVPHDGEGGFIAFSNPRRPRPKSLPSGADDLLQPNLPLTLEPQPAVRDADADAAEMPALQRDPDVPAPLSSQDPIPEAPHIWVEPEPAAEAIVVNLAEVAPAQTEPVQLDPVQPEAIQADPVQVVTAPDLPFSPPPEGTDPAEALMPDPTQPEIPNLAGLAARLRALTNAPDMSALEDLHARLGLLHAQMAEALRLRR